MSDDAKAHARLSASSAHRWMLCPGSVNLSAPFADEESPAAAEGTFAHTYAAGVLDPTHNLRPAVSDEMAKHVKVYTDHCEAVRHVSAGSSVEADLTPHLVTIDPDLGGIGDFVSFDNDDLNVIDLKYGAGVFVDAKNNPQLKMYGLGALIKLQRLGKRVSGVVGTIVQPRIDCEEGPVRSDRWSVAELVDFAAEVQAAAKVTRQADAPLVPGEKQCKFCKAKPICPALAAQSKAVMAAEFPAMGPLDDAGRARLGAAIDMIPQVKDQIKALEALAYREIAGGRAVPGYKLVAKRGQRRWNDTVAAERLAREALGDEACTDPELKSPAQIEALVGKAEFKNSFASLATTVSSGYALVAATDKRPAVALVSATDFPALSADETD